jgi:hypothetical protein
VIACIAVSAAAVDVDADPLALDSHHRSANELGRARVVSDH